MSKNACCNSEMLSSKNLSPVLTSEIMNNSENCRTFRKATKSWNKFCCVSMLMVSSGHIFSWAAPFARNDSFWMFKLPFIYRFLSQRSQLETINSQRMCSAPKAAIFWGGEGKELFSFLVVVSHSVVLKDLFLYLYSVLSFQPPKLWVLKYDPEQKQLSEKKGEIVITMEILVLSLSVSMSLG